jgi:universal stress protein E
MRETILRWNPILVGVDGSPESAGAAIVGARLAEATGTSCHLVHAVQDPGTAFAAMVLHENFDTLEGAVARLERPAVHAALQPFPPPSLLDAIEIRIGRPVTVLRSEAARLRAGLVILGGKRHSMHGWWFRGATARDAIRTLSVPVLVTKGTPPVLQRVLVGLDFSHAAVAAIRQAKRFTVLADGQLRALHVLEPMTILPNPNAGAATRAADASPVHLLERHLWPLLPFPQAQRTVRAGHPATALAAEAVEWHADLLVVGTRRKRWVDRLLLGTVTESLLDRLPVSLLAVPVRASSVPERFLWAEGRN